MDNITDYDDLIIKCLAGEACEQEIRLLTEMMQMSGAVNERFLSLKNVWDSAADPSVADNLNIDSSFNTTLQAIIDHDNQRPGRWHRHVMRIAAMLTLPLMALSAYLYFNGATGVQPSPISQEITAMPGCLIHTYLPDSTEIWINGGSTLRYSQDSGRNYSRRVEMDGEIFFNVAHDKEHPFVVYTPSDITVNALGTQFNVRSYASDTLTSVTLIEGLVAVGPEGNISTLSPNNSMVYNTLTGDNNLYLGNTDKMVSWRHGRLQFKNEMLKDVYKRLGQIYDVDFIVDPRLEDVIFYATFDNASLEQIMSLIRRSTPLKYTTDQDADHRTITVTPQ